MLNGGTATAVSLTDNTGATINFTGGGLDIDATSGDRIPRDWRRHRQRHGHGQHDHDDERHGLERREHEHRGERPDVSQH